MDLKTLAYMKERVQKGEKLVDCINGFNKIIDNLEQKSGFLRIEVGVRGCWYGITEETKIESGKLFDLLQEDLKNSLIKIRDQVQAELDAL